MDCSHDSCDYIISPQIGTRTSSSTLRQRVLHVLCDGHIVRGIGTLYLQVATNVYPLTVIDRYSHRKYQQQRTVRLPEHGPNQVFKGPVAGMMRGLIKRPPSKVFPCRPWTNNPQAPCSTIFVPPDDSWHSILKRFLGADDGNTIAIRVWLAVG